MTERDRIFAESPVDGPFEFSACVADVFPDMIRRSVPGYETVLQLLSVVARELVRDGTCCYDLGASLGAATLAIRHGIAAEDCRIVAVDSSIAMVERCRTIVDRDPAQVPVEVREQDIRKTPVENASLVVMNYTLQFLPPEDRAPLLERIAAGLCDGGALVLSDKVRHADEDRNALLVRLHHAFKRTNGYSDLEIARKRNALEKVLIPDTLEIHRHRLEQAGFRIVEPIAQGFNFVSLLALR